MLLSREVFELSGGNHSGCRGSGELEARSRVCGSCCSRAQAGLVPAESRHPGGREEAAAHYGGLPAGAAAAPGAGEAGGGAEPHLPFGKRARA